MFGVFTFDGTKDILLGAFPTREIANEMAGILVDLAKTDFAFVREMELTKLEN